VRKPPRPRALESARSIGGPSTVRRAFFPGGEQSKEPTVPSVSRGGSARGVCSNDIRVGGSAEPITREAIEQAREPRQVVAGARCRSAPELGGILDRGSRGDRHSTGQHDVVVGRDQSGSRSASSRSRRPQQAQRALTRTLPGTPACVSGRNVLRVQVRDARDDAASSHSCGSFSAIGSC